MGRQQQVKRERHAGTAPKHRAAPPTRSQAWLSWLIGVIVVVGLLIAALVIFIQANQARFLKLSVVTSAQKIQADLSHARAAFTLEESARLQSILTEIEQLATQRELDRQLGGHLMFILQVAKEIVASGKLQTGELKKMDMLLRDVQRRLKASSPSDQTGP